MTELFSQFMAAVVAAWTFISRAVAGWWSAPAQPSRMLWLLAGVLALLAALVLLLVDRRRRKPQRGRVLEMLVSHGEITHLGADAPPSSLDAALAPLLSDRLVPPTGSFQLQLVLSNLNAYPVQLVELGLRSDNSRLLGAVTASAVVPHSGSVDVVADEVEVGGSLKSLELYLYAPQLAKHPFRLVVPVVWEPWAGRYRLRGLDGHTHGVARLATAELSEAEQKRYEAERRRENAEARRLARLRGASESRVLVNAADQVAPEPEVPAREESPPKRSLEFPDEF